MLTGHEARKVARLLCIGAEAPELVDAEIRVRAVGQPDRTGNAADLLHRDDVFEVAKAEAAVFLGHRHAEQAHGSEFGPEFAREAVAAVDLVGLRRNAPDCELADGLAQLIDACAEFEVEIDREHGALRRGPACQGHDIVRQSDRQVGV